jgi:hypothetical protein
VEERARHASSGCTLGISNKWNLRDNRNFCGPNRVGIQLKKFEGVIFLAVKFIQCFRFLRHESRKPLSPGKPDGQAPNYQNEESDRNRDSPVVFKTFLDRRSVAILPVEDWHRENCLGKIRSAAQIR